MNQDTVIFGRACVNHPDLTVSVNRTILGTYRVVFRDTDADAVIETRIFKTCMRAYDYAQTLINQT
jgi:hypothetical protein